MSFRLRADRHTQPTPSDTATLWEWFVRPKKGLDPKKRDTCFAPGLAGAF